MDAPYPNIAVIDDDPGIRQSLRNLLKCLGYGVELYASAAEFIVSAPTTTASILIIDVELGDVSGIDLAQQLAAGGLIRPIVFITASHDELLRRSAMALGCVAYLHKPFPPRQLMLAIAKATGDAPKD